MPRLVRPPLVALLAALAALLAPLGASAAGSVAVVARQAVAGATRGEVDGLLTEWGEPRYRADQLWDALHVQQRALDDITTLPRALRDKLATALPLVVVITSLGVDTERMSSSTAAALVAAAMVSVLVYPLIGARLRASSAPG